MGKTATPLRESNRKIKAIKTPKPGLRRLARRAGVKRLSKDVYEESFTLLKQRMEQVVQNANIYREHAHRKTFTAGDVVHAERRAGRVLYGYGD